MMPNTPPPWLTEGYTHLWLPYTQMQWAELPHAVASAEGVTLTLTNGTKLLDGIASWWSACHGYSHPYLIKAIKEQAEHLSHVMFAGLANEPAYRLARRLTEIAPHGLTRVFFSDSGSTAVEVAMKMAVQYWANKGQPKRNKFLCFRNGYHGDTMGAMSLADPDKGMHRAFNHYMPEQYSVELPVDEYSLAEFQDMLSSGLNETTAALIIEPLVQGAGGMKFHSADMLAEIHRICKANDILFIADEIMTGFGRTGSMFACHEAGITPDLMCLGKALTGGMMTLAATLATEEIFSAFLSDELTRAFMHGPTYMGNALACAVANASLDLFEQEPRLRQVEAIEQQLYDELTPLRKHERVAEARVKGAIGVVQLHDASWKEMFALRKRFVEQGVWLRPFNDIIYVTPSLTIHEDELRKITAAISCVASGL